MEETVKLNPLESEVPKGKKVKKEKSVEQPQKVRKRRKRKESGAEPTFFVLKDGKLQAVKIAWGVWKPIKRKELPEGERTLLSVWNRNKDLFK